MMKRDLIKIAGLIAAMAVVLSLGGLVFADETEDATEPEEEVFEEYVYEETIVIDDGYDNDYLAQQFILDAIDPSMTPSLRAYDYTSQLSGATATAVSSLLPQVRAVANGQQTSTVMKVQELSWSFTASELGLANLNDKNAAYIAASERVAMYLDSNTVVRTLMSACPFEMYWFDKTAGSTYICSYWVSGNRVIVDNVRFQFAVAGEYQDTGAQTPLYTVSSKYGTSVAQAASNVANIINTFASLGDYNKLLAYKMWICDHVAYNEYAADSGNDVPYGNPWQLIWVFDGDSSTDVVCEGYAKAFQYLCDKSSFVNNNVYAVTVYGGMYDQSGIYIGSHMWNVMHMDDGCNYLVDVTNCDLGYDLFLTGATGSVSGGYRDYYNGYWYAYDINVTAMFPTAVLTLNSIPYAVPGATVEMYRMYNPDSSEHLYTSNAGERNWLMSIGWNYEGLGWTAPVISHTPVYRLYNPNAPGGDHHYTINAGERDWLVSVGWVYEGIAFYSDDARTVPLYREYNPNATERNHNYTADAGENRWLVSVGWRYEGVGFYGV